MTDSTCTDRWSRQYPQRWAPLTARQMRLWRDPAFRRRGWRTCAISVRVSGPLDIAALRSSLLYLVERHEALRTRFVLIGNEAVQQIDPPSEDFLEVVETGGEVTARNLAQRFLEQGIDLAHGPLFDAKLYRISAAEHALIIALDHMIADGVSFEILARELWTLYQQAVKAMPFVLPKLPMQFADYVQWQHQTYENWLQEHASYWRERLGGVEPFAIPQDCGRQNASVEHAATFVFIVPDSVRVALRRIAGGAGIPLSLVVLTLYAGVLSCWCARHDLLLVCALHGRYRPELTSLIGFLANLLHIRVELIPEDSWLDLSRRINQEFTRAYEHRDYDRVPDLIAGCESEAFFNWLSTSAMTQFLPLNWTINWLPTGSIRRRGEQAGRLGELEITPFPTMLPWRGKFVPAFYETAAGIEVAIAYSPALLDEMTVRRFADCFQLCAESFAVNPLSSVLSTLTIGGRLSDW